MGVGSGGMSLGAFFRGLMVAFFGAAVFLQFNDPDPFPWVLIYGLSAVLTAVEMAVDLGWSLSTPRWVWVVGIWGPLLYLPVNVALPFWGGLGQPLSESLSEAGGLLIVSGWLFSLRKTSVGS